MASKFDRPEMKKLKSARLRTPPGIARFAYISKPDDSTYGKGQFRLTVVFDKADPEFKTFYKKLKELRDQHNVEIGKPKGKGSLPIKLVDEKMSKGKDGTGGTGDEVGQPYMQLSANGSYQNRAGETVDITIPVFNAAAQEEQLLIYGGDIVRAQANIAGWKLGAEFGIKAYLDAVQLLKSNWSSQAGSTFTAEEEYLTDENESDADADELGDEAEGFSDEDLEDESDPVTEASDEATSEADGNDDDPLDELLG